jgi:glycosyltransferase involved in cell wall biosynthesis
MSDKLRIILLMRGGIEWIGGVEYIKNLVFALSSSAEYRSGHLEINLLASRRDQQTSLQAMSPNLHRIYFVEDEFEPVNIVGRIKWKLAREIFKIQNGRYDAFFKRCGFDFAYPHLGSTRGSGGVRSAAWIYDFQHKFLNDYFSPQEIQDRDAAFSTIADYAPCVVLSSRCAEHDFHRFFPRAKDKSRVLSFRTVPQLHWHQGNPDSVRAKYHLPSRFFLLSSQFWKHKNHLFVFEALRRLRAQGITPSLVCTGHLHDYRDHDYSSLVLQAIQRGGIADQVHLLGLVPRDDYIQLLRQAVAVVQPSLFEGWSTVVEDARCLGKRILMSDIPVHREQSPKDASYFDVHDPESLMEQIVRTWTIGTEGPHQEQEEEALQDQEVNVSNFAKRFLEIASRE